MPEKDSFLVIYRRASLAERMAAIERIKLKGNREREKFLRKTSDDGRCLDAPMAMRAAVVAYQIAIKVWPEAGYQ